MAIIIGISGKMGTGKTTLANALAPKFQAQGCNVLKIAFGDAVKNEACQLYDFNKDAYNTPHGKQCELPIDHMPRFFWPIKSVGKATPRQIWQYYATEIVRKVNPFYWVAACNRAIKVWEDQIQTEGCRVVIIDDVRFPNEYNYIHNSGGPIIRIHPYPAWRPGQHAHHESETALDQNFEFTYNIWPEYGQLQALADGTIVQQMHSSVNFILPQTTVTNAGATHAN